MRTAGTRDRLFSGAISCRQPSGGYRFSLDAALLVHFVMPGKNIASSIWALVAVPSDSSLSLIPPQMDTAKARQFSFHLPHASYFQLSFEILLMEQSLGQNSLMGILYTPI
jgi:hypothetical protein